MFKFESGGQIWTKQDPVVINQGITLKLRSHDRCISIPLKSSHDTDSFYFRLVYQERIVSIHLPYVKS